MYAGRIKVISSDKGSGVNMQGHMAANTGALSINEDGKLTLRSAKVKGELTARSKSGSVRVEEAIFAEEPILLEGFASTEVAENAVVYGKGDVTIGGKTVAVGKDAIVAAGADIDGTLSQEGKLTIRADILRAGGAKVASGKLLSILAGEVHIANAKPESGSTLHSNGDIEFKSHTFHAENSNSTAVGNISITTDGPLRLFLGNYRAGNLLSIEAADITSSAQLASSKGTASRTKNGGVHNLGRISSGEDIAIETVGLTNDGQILGQGKIDLKASSHLTNTAKATISGGKIFATNSDKLVNHGLISTNQGWMKLQARSEFTNSGTLQSSTAATLQSATSFNNTGQILAAQSVKVSVTDGGLINSGNVKAGEIELGSKTFANSGDLTAGKVLVTNMLENIDNTGTMTASDLLLRVGRQLTNRGRLFGSNKVAIDGKDAGFAGEVINASKAVINGGGHLYVAADKLWNAGSMGSANGPLEFRASGNIVNEKGLFYSKGNSLFQVGRDFVNIHGDVTSEQGMTIKGLLNPRAAALWNEAGTIQAVRGNLTIDAEQVNNKRVPLVVDVRSSTTVRNKPVKRDIYRGNSKTTITTTRERGRVSGTPAKILAGGNMTINASGVTNSYSQIAAGGALTIHAGTVVNEGRDLLQTVNTETTTQFSELYCKRRVLGVCLKKKKNNWSETTHDKKVSVIGSIFGTIQAGGALVVQAAGYTKNIAIRSNAGALNLSANGKAMSAVAAPASVVVPKIADPSPLEFSIQSVLGRPAIFQQAG